MILRFDEFVNENILIKAGDKLKQWGNSYENRKNITGFMNDHHIFDFDIKKDENGYITDFYGDMEISADDLVDGVLPYRLGFAGGDFECPELVSNEGFPTKIEGDLKYFGKNYTEDDIRSFCEVEGTITFA